MKIAVSTYSYHAKVQTGDMTQLECITRAKEAGFDGIEICGIVPHDNSDMENYALRLRKSAESENLPIVNFTVGADFLNCGPLGLKDEINRVKKMVDIAHLLGAPGIRHDATIGYPTDTREYRGFSSVLPLLSGACREITEYAAEKGIRTMVENHGFFCQDSERVESLVNTVAHENFGLLVDMGNFLCADEDPEIAVGRVAPYAFYVHAKDFHRKSGTSPDPGEGFFLTRAANYLRGTIVGHGVVPVPQCLHILKTNGYDGFVGIEFEGMEENHMALRIGLTNLRRWLP